MVLINCSNLHVGGGVQVAVSFVSEILRKESNDLDLFVWVSSEVASGLNGLGFDLDDHPMVSVQNVYGIEAFFSPLSKKLDDFEIVFTVFGPNYLRGRGYFDLVGFAQFWILDKSLDHILRPFPRITNRLKYTIQKFFFKRSDALVVELEHVRDELIKNKISNSKSVYVAKNCVSQLYLNCELWQDVVLPYESNNFCIGFVGRDYPHKNTTIIPEIKRLLKECYSLDVDFFVTLNEGEWAAKSDDFKNSVFNVGSLDVAQCPKFYKAMDAVLFPSLLECFSATPLEAMAMRRPLFASDRRFVKDICADYAFYFDPFDPADAAKVIADYIFNSHRHDDECLEKARQYALGFANAKGRAERYLEIIKACSRYQ